MKITESNGKISIDTPYNADFVTKIKAAGAKWNTSTKTWQMDARSIASARAIMREVYGQDDLPCDTVSVKVTIKKDIRASRAPIVILGRTIASAKGRDTGARIGDGVCFESGKADSGGSMNNWCTIIEEGSVIILYDIAKNAVTDMIGVDPEYCGIEVVELQTPKTALAEEKERLLARLAEIEAELAKKE